MGTVGIIVNPRSGRLGDSHQLSIADSQEKQAMISQIVAGISAAVGIPGSAEKIKHRLCYYDDPQGITRAAIKQSGDNLEAIAVDATQSGTIEDTISAAKAMARIPCNIVITLGGDGTCRALALGWQNAPLIPIATGTNNIFPQRLETTIAGAAAGLICSGRIQRASVVRQAKVIQVAIDGEDADLALVSAVLSREHFIGREAVLAPEQLALALLTRASPSDLGISAIGGLLDSVPDTEDAGLLLKFGSGGERVIAPIAPGYYREIGVQQRRPVNFVEEIELKGPGVLALDGERHRLLKPGQKAWFQLSRSGPWVVNTAAVLAEAVANSVFVRPPTD